MIKAAGFKKAVISELKCDTSELLRGERGQSCQVFRVSRELNSGCPNARIGNSVGAKPGR